MAQDHLPHRERRPFSLSTDLPDPALHDALPQALQAPQGPVLAARLADLMASAQCHRIDFARRAHDQLADQFDSIRSAAGAFDMNGTPLEEVLWIGPAEWRSASASPAQGDSGANLTAGDELVILFAPEVNRRAAYPSRSAPIAVRDGIDRRAASSGALVVLGSCELDWLGKARALRGFAQAILGPDAFMPILVDLERVVLRVLLALQERLGDLGRDCVIERTWDGVRVSPWIALRTANALKEVNLLISCSDSELRQTDGLAFTVTLANLADGTFVRWLEQHFM